MLKKIRIVNYHTIRSQIKHLKCRIKLFMTACIRPVIKCNKSHRPHVYPSPACTKGAITGRGGILDLDSNPNFD